MRGRFIQIEGIDGTGKTTQQRLLAGHIIASGRRVLAIDSPSKWYREQPEVADFINHGHRKIGANALASLAASDRMLATDKVIDPALNSGMDVVVARYTTSGIAYAAQRGADIDFVRAVNARVAQPSHGLFLEIDPDLALERIRARGEETTHEENSDYLASVQKLMKQEWPDKFLIVDAALPEDEILERAAWYTDKEEV